MADWMPIPKTYDPLKAGSIDGTDTVPHDKAVWRAMNAKYKPNKDVVGVPENTVFVGRLNLNTDEETIEDYFSKYGKIKRFRLVRDIVTGFSKGNAFIEYFDEDTAYRTQKNLDKTILDEKEIYVDFECERILQGWIPRRLGGGIGGKKESGQLRFGGKNRPFRKPFNIKDVKAPEGKTFRDRLRAVDTGYLDRNSFGRDKGRDQERDSDRERDRERENRERDRGRERDSRSNRDSYSDRGHSRENSRRRDSDRSRSREASFKDSRLHYRSRSRERRSRSKERKRKY